MAPGPYPTYQPVYQPPHRTMNDMMKTLVSDWILALGVVVGLFVMWIGAVVWGSADSADGRDWGEGLKSFGMLVLSVVLFLGALLRHDIEKWVRVAMLASVTLLLLVVGFWGGFW